MASGAGSSSETVLYAQTDQTELVGGDDHPRVCAQEYKNYVGIPVRPRCHDQGGIAPFRTAPFYRRLCKTASLSLLASGLLALSANVLSASPRASLNCSSAASLLPRPRSPAPYQSRKDGFSP
jgi:hypothetical protein